MAEPNMIYKISVLLLLSKVDFPLSNAQIVQFYLDKEYTDYFTIQQVISDLEEAHLVTVNQSHNNTMYALTDEGMQTLSLMRDKVSSAIEADMVEYLTHHKFEIKNGLQPTMMLQRAAVTSSIANSRKMDTPCWIYLCMPPPANRLRPFAPTGKYDTKTFI